VLRKQRNRIAALRITPLAERLGASGTVGRDGEAASRD
jgi:hypothetical protein